VDMDDAVGVGVDALRVLLILGRRQELVADVHAVGDVPVVLGGRRLIRRRATEGVQPLVTAVPDQENPRHDDDREREIPRRRRPTPGGAPTAGPSGARDLSSGTLLCHAERGTLVGRAALTVVASAVGGRPQFQRRVVGSRRPCVSGGPGPAGCRNHLRRQRLPRRVA
jgi:hypothetical protein